MESLDKKTQKAIELYTNLVKNVNESFEHKTREFNKQLELPKFI